MAAAASSGRAGSGRAVREERARGETLPTCPPPQLLPGPGAPSASRRGAVRGVKHEQNSSLFPRRRPLPPPSRHAALRGASAVSPPPPGPQEPPAASPQPLRRGLAAVCPAGCGPGGRGEHRAPGRAEQNPRLRASG